MDELTRKHRLFILRTEKSVFKFVLERDTSDVKINLTSRYKEQDIPVGWMSDTGLIVKVHFATFSATISTLVAYRA
jgi:hypothetical protein